MEDVIIRRARVVDYSIDDLLECVERLIEEGCEEASQMLDFLNTSPREPLQKIATWAFQTGLLEGYSRCQFKERL